MLYLCLWGSEFILCVYVCFAGYMLSVISADLLIQPLNYSVVFLRKNVLFWQMTFGSLRYILMRVRMKRYFQRLRKIYLQSRTEGGNDNHFWNKIDILLKTLKSTSCFQTSFAEVKSPSKPNRIRWWCFENSFWNSHSFWRVRGA